jgi:hypothetical protein
VVGADDQPLEPRAVVTIGLVAVEPVRAQHGSLDQRGRHLVADVMGQLPAQRPRAELAGAGLRGPGRRACSLGVELVALPQPDQ